MREEEKREEDKENQKEEKEEEDEERKGNLLTEIQNDDAETGISPLQVSPKSNYVTIMTPH